MKKLIYAKTRINGQEKHLADVSYKPVSYFWYNLLYFGSLLSIYILILLSVLLYS